MITTRLQMTGTKSRMPRALTMPQPDDHSRSLGAFAPVLVLLAIGVLINYIDRGNISIAGPLLKRELGLSASQLGILFAAFFSTYTAMQFVIGWLVDRFDVNRILAAGFLLWSLATAATGVVRGFILLLAMRLILGIGESVAFPACTKIMARHLPEHHRGFASGVLLSATKWGNAIGTLVAGLLMAKFGWRPVFIWVGLVSLLWLPAWSKWMPREGRGSSGFATRGPSFIAILEQRSFWGASAGHFCHNYLLYFMVTWLPSYLVLGRHLSMTTMSGIAGLYYSVDAVSAVASGWLQDFAIRSGYTPTLVRKSAMAIGFSIAAVALLGCAVADPRAYVPWLLVAGVGCGMTGAGVLCFSATLAGPQAAGTWYGIQNGFGNLAGVVGPALTGFVLQRTGNFLIPFAVTSALCIVGVLAWVFIVGRVEPVSWASKGQPSVMTVSAQA
jgi:MFS transporter, ACS family, D-galactonate transporter